MTFLPLYALVTREYFGEKVMGSAYGAVFLISTLGMGLGSFAGGWVFDHLGSYAWLFIGSTAIGPTGRLLALTLRAPRLLPAVPVSLEPAGQGPIAVYTPPPGGFPLVPFSC